MKSLGEIAFDTFGKFMSAGLELVDGPPKWTELSLLSMKSWEEAAKAVREVAYESIKLPAGFGWLVGCVSHEEELTYTYSITRLQTEPSLGSKVAVPSIGEGEYFIIFADRSARTVGVSRTQGGPRAGLVGYDEVVRL